MELHNYIYINIKISQYKYTPSELFRNKDASSVLFQEVSLPREAQG